jgi:hypothetical protein
VTTRLTCLVLGFGMVGFSALAYAQGAGTGVLKLPQDIEFKGPLTGPPQTVVLYGDPTKPGLFVSRVKFSAGWKDLPHWHPDEMRTVVVLSGTLYFGSGEKWDESKFKAYEAPHFSWAKDGEVIIQITGIGPSGKDVHSTAIVASYYRTPPYLLTDPPQFDTLVFGPGWRVIESNSIN